MILSFPLYWSQTETMKFGKEFQTHLEETLPEWRDKFLSYKLLKKLLKQMSTADAALNAPDLSIGAAQADDAGAERNQPWVGLEEWFVRILDEELEKFNDFYVDKEEDFVIRLQVLSSISLIFFWFRWLGFVIDCLIALGLFVFSAWKVIFHK